MPRIASVRNLPEHPSWMKRGACRGLNPNLFFNEIPGNTNCEEAIRTCNICAVKGLCLDYALENNENIGVWGGKTEQERRAMKRAMNQKKRDTA